MKHLNFLRAFCTLLTLVCLGTSAWPETMSVDFEETDLSNYSAWTFGNLSTHQTNSNLRAHGGSYFGSCAATSAYAATTTKISSPQSIVCYYNKLTTNTNNSSLFKIQVSSDGQTWNDVILGKTMDQVTRGTWEELSADLSSYSNVFVRVFYTGTNAGRAIDDIKLTYTTSGGDNPSTPTALPVPTNLQSSNITTTGATLSWMAVANASSYTVKIGETEYTDVNANSYSATGLTAGTQYTWSVKAVGDGKNYTTSAYAANTTFTTEEEQGGGDDSSDDNIVIVFAANSSNSDSNTAWNTSSSLSNVFSSGSNYVNAITATNNVYPARNTLVNGVKFGTSNAAGSISFTLKEVVNVDKIIVSAAAYGDSEGQTGFTLNGIDKAMTGAQNKVYADYEVSMSGAEVSTITLTQKQAKSGRIYVKSITIVPIENATPTALGVPTNLASSNMTTDGATLSWDAVEHASSYTVKIGDTEHSGVNTNSYKAAGLTSNTAYNWTVKAVGDGTNYSTSDYASTVSFKTAPALLSIAVSGTPTKLTYEVGETLDPSGLVVTANYEGGSSEVVTEDINWTFDPNTFALDNTSCSVIATWSGKKSTAYTVSDIVVNAPSVKYNISLTQPTMATIESSLTSAAEGVEVTLSYRDIAEHYHFVSWSVVDAESNPIDVADNKFTMPASNVTVSATFEEEAKYAVNIATPINGSISVKNGETPISDGDEVYAGTTLTLKVTANDGYEPDELTIKDASNNPVVVTDNAFVMPISDITISATFKEKPTVYEIDFESETTTTYSDWTFTNITSKATNSSVTAHGGSYFGKTNGTETASIATKEKITYPRRITFYISKQTTNTTASSWKIQYSSNGTSWTDIKTENASSMERGTWVEVSQDLGAYEDVYIRIYYAGSTAVRTIDDVLLTYSNTPNPSISAENITLEPEDEAGEISYIINNPDGSTLLAAEKVDVDWIDNVFVDENSMKVTFSTTANLGKTREAYITFTYGTYTKDVKVTQQKPDFTTLPLNVEAGLTHSQLCELNGLSCDLSGENYANETHKIKFKTANDYFQIKTNSRIGSCTFSLLGAVSEGSSSVKVSESTDGTSWNEVETFTVSFSAQNEVKEHVVTTAFDEYSRYIKFEFLKKSGEVNFGLGKFTINAYSDPTLLAVSGAEYATYFHATQAFIMPANLEGITVEGVSENTLTLETRYVAGDVVPAGEALLLHGEAGNYNLVAATTDNTKIAANKLKGTSTADEWTTGGDKYYRLSQHNGEVGFYWGAADGAAFQPGANKAYLAVPNNTTGNAPARFLLGRQDVPTDLLNVSDNNQSTKVMIDGRLYILRDGKAYDSFGRMVK